MKIFYSEGKPCYESYTFNYGIYCIKESQEELPDIYSRGFLPYSANPKYTQELFYLARSLRVNLDQFSDTSENRRLDRKISELDITLDCQPKEKVLEIDSALHDFCLTYTKQRIGENMPAERLKYIWTLSTGSHIFTFSTPSKKVGYVLASIQDNMLHYWFSFFDLDLMRSHSIGKWMMWRVISWAKEKGLDHIYLGTCYGTKSLYKVRDHKGLSFYDGLGWNENMRTLKDWCKQDGKPRCDDRLKQSEHADYLQHTT